MLEENAYCTFYDILCNCNTL